MDNKIIDLLISFKHLNSSEIEAYFYNDDIPYLSILIDEFLQYFKSSNATQQLLDTLDLILASIYNNKIDKKYLNIFKHYSSYNKRLNNVLVMNNISEIK